MTIRESAVQRCPVCRRTFRVLADEVDTHPCPFCGYAPWDDEKERHDDRDNISE